jgi:hypothetical protein
MAKQQVSFKSFNLTQVLQFLIGLLFICMGIIGFSTNKGLGADFSRELSKAFGSDRELLMLAIATVELLCGIFLVAALFVKAIPSKVTKVATIAVMVLWLAIIVVLDVVAVDFGRMEGLTWFVWLETLVLHLIIFVGILLASGRKTLA